jgi:hypothetical protein
MGESNFVQINSSVADLLSAAGDLVIQGESLSNDMASLLGTVDGLEGPHAWGGDDFGNKFLDNGEGGYHFPVKETGQVTADAVKGMTRYDGKGNDNTLGGSLATLGNSLSSGLLDGSDTDADSAGGFQSI